MRCILCNITEENKELNSTLQPEQVVLKTISNSRSHELTSQAAQTDDTIIIFWHFIYDMQHTIFKKKLYVTYQIWDKGCFCDILCNTFKTLVWMEPISIVFKVIWMLQRAKCSKIYKIYILLPVYYNYMIELRSKLQFLFKFYPFHRLPLYFTENGTLAPSY